MPDRQHIADAMRQALPLPYQYLADRLAQELVALAAGNDDARRRLEEPDLRDALHTLDGQSLPLDTGGDLIIVGDIHDSHGLAFGRDARAITIRGVTINIVPAPQRPLNLDERASALATYRQGLLDETALVNVAGIPLPRDQTGLPIRLDMPLDRVYIRLQTMSEESARREREIERHDVSRHIHPIKANQERPHDILEVLRSLGEYFYRQGTIYEERKRATPVDPYQALREHHRLVVLGPPGSGKSTLLRFLARSAASKSNESLPILVPLREYATWRGTGSNTSLRDFALDRAAGGDMARRQALVEAPRKLWLLDALDEARGWRDDVTRQAALLEGDLIITSRPLDYQPGPLGILPHFEVLPLGLPDVDQFLRDWFGVLAERGSHEAAWVDERVAWLRAQLAARARIARLVRNPLLLTFLVILAGQNPLEDLPTQRAHLYQRYIEELFDSWEGQRRPHTGVSGDPYIVLGSMSGSDARAVALRGFYYIGWYLHMAYYGGPRDYQATAEALQTMLARYLGVQLGTAKDIVMFWQEAGILDNWTIDATTFLAFRHLTFQEYAASRCIADICRQDMNRGWTFLQPRLHHYAWREPILLLVGTLDTVDHHRALMLRLMRGDSPYERALYRDLRLAAALIGEGVLCAPIDRDRVIERLEHALQRSTRLGLIEGEIVIPDTDQTSQWIARLIMGIWPICYAEGVVRALGQSGDSQAVPALLQAIHGNTRAVRKAATDALKQINDPKAIPVLLLQALHNKNWHVEWAAADALRRIGNIEAVPTLLQALRDESQNVRNKAAEILRKINDSQAVPILLQALVDENQDVRRAAVGALAQIGGPQTVPALLPILQDENQDVRRAAVGALAQIGGPQAFPALLPILQDENQDMRRAVVSVLRLSSDPQAIGALLQALQDESQDVRRAATAALGQIGDRQAIPVLLQALQDESGEVRRAAASVLGRVGDSQAVPALLQALQDESGEVRRAAAVALGQIEGAQAIPALLQALRDESGEVRWAAATALGQIGNSQAVPGLLQALLDRSWDVYRAAANVLGQIGHPQAVPGLLQALRDMDQDRRRVAAWELGRINNSQAMLGLLQILSDPHEDMRRVAANVLGRTGNSHAVPALVQALGDQSRAVRRAAADALGQIGNTQALPALLQALRHSDSDTRLITTQSLRKLSERVEEKDKLEKIASALWKRLNDDKDIVDAALTALEHVANRLAVVAIKDSSREDPLLLSPHLKL